MRNLSSVLVITLLFSIVLLAATIPLEAVAGPEDSLQTLMDMKMP